MNSKYNNVLNQLQYYMIHDSTHRRVHNQYKCYLKQKYKRENIIYEDSDSDEDIGIHFKIKKNCHQKKKNCYHLKQKQKNYL